MKLSGMFIWHLRLCEEMTGKSAIINVSSFFKQMIKFKNKAFLQNVLISERIATAKVPVDGVTIHH